MSEWKRRGLSITVGTNLEDGANAVLTERRLSHLMRLDISLVRVAVKRPEHYCWDRLGGWCYCWPPGEEAVLPDEVGYLAGLSGSEEN